MTEEKNEVIKFRSAKMRLLLYPDDPEHVKALKIIEESYEYAYILHEPEEDTKKAHWHVVLRFKNAQWNTSIAKNLGISLNYIRNCNNLDKALQYLIHYNDFDKKQYDISCVVGPLVDRLKISLNKKERTEDEEAKIIIDYIDNQSEIISFTKFAKYCVDNGYWATFRRGQNIFRILINEHNDELRSIELKKIIEERIDNEQWINYYNVNTEEIYSTPFDYKKAEFDFLDKNS